VAARRIAEAESRSIHPVKAIRVSRNNNNQPTHSESRPKEGPYEFFLANEPLPVALNLHFDTRIDGGTAVAREQLNRDTLLIRAQDPNFSHCWFSLPLDFGAASGNPAFWMLEKTARDTWLLSLRQSSGDVAAYHLKTKKDAFPITLKKDRVSKEFTNWPGTITVSWA
jgi:hypothetical protein